MNKLVEKKVDGELISPVLPDDIKNYLIDIDGTICDDIPNEEPERMATAALYPDALETLNKWYEQGHYITFFTSRIEEHREVTEIWLKENGFKYPKTYQINSLEDCNLIEVFPLVLKPYLGGGGSANTYIVQSIEELRFFCSQMLKQNIKFIAQEYVGTPDEEYTVGVLSDLDGNLINSIAVQRMIKGSLGCRIKIPNHTDNKSLGKELVISSGISQGRIGKYLEITSKCEKIASSLGSTGPLNIQCRYVNGEVYLFEINPRYSGTTSFRAMAGINEPELMIKKHFLNLDIERNASLIEGYILRGLDEVFIKD